MKRLLTLTIILSALLVAGCTKNNTNYTALEPMSSKKCQSMGGGITEVNPESNSCPNKQEFLGMLNDVNCICACCK